MDNSKDQGSKIANNEENPSNNSETLVGSSVLPVVGEENGNPNRSSSVARTPFTNLSQVDADLALARTLQDQERAYMMLRMNGDGSEHESWETGSYAHDDDDEFDHHNSEYDGSDADEGEDAFDVHGHLDLGSGEEDIGNQGVDLDPASFPNDEAYARALQDAEDQEMAARFLALTGINEMVTEEDDDIDDHGGNSQDTWDDVDPDELSYEELLALGEVVGTESRGLSADSIASLRSVVYKTQNSHNGSSETCVICRLDYEDGDNLILLSCKHSYHSECITNWLQINKVCPVCSTEVSTSGSAS
ncbi:E3 ubiquitin ligase BIG BROTHER-related [Cynara cardunculus var. scolymus]|uniref:E3 ubiquitin ligase BIG BROTHER-related n=1 Tax=Cynara cardunculus var. scolymus TaxID=59895 RepID=UPI000D629B20|nr:E3 ubiquitin ligase BIG BROTHER-related [Cynara cardunculus var. scolymus]